MTSTPLAKRLATFNAFNELSFAVLIPSLIWLLTQLFAIYWLWLFSWNLAAGVEWVMCPPATPLPITLDLTHLVIILIRCIPYHGIMIVWLAMASICSHHGGWDMVVSRSSIWFDYLEDTFRPWLERRNRDLLVALNIELQLDWDPKLCEVIGTYYDLAH